MKTYRVTFIPAFWRARHLPESHDYLLDTHYLDGKNYTDALGKYYRKINCRERDKEPIVYEYTEL